MYAWSAFEKNVIGNCTFRSETLCSSTISPRKPMRSASKDFPFVVISPQCPKDTWWRVDGLYQLVNHVAGSLKIDRRRMYVTGLSMGGFGSWQLMDRYPKLFAAGVPICGGGKAGSAKNLVDIPIWAFHGDADGVVKADLSKLMIKAIE